MKKVRIYQRKDRPGWYCQWREGGRRRTKQLNTKAEAEHFSQAQYIRINSDVFTAHDVTWCELVSEYLQTYDLRGLAAASKYDAQKTLKLFQKICRPVSSRRITQRMIDYFIIKRSDQVASPYTVNSSISRIRAFCRWMTKRRYHPGGLDIVLQKTQPPLVTALSTDQVRGLFARAPTEAWRIRLLLSLVTGLRKSDIDNLAAADIDIAKAAINTRSQKTGKVFADRPLPDDAMGIIKVFFNSLPAGQEMLFADKNVRKVWDSFRAGTRRKDLRITFSTLIQKIGSIGSARDLLEHSDSRTTRDFYTDHELILRWKVNQLPVSEWLDGCEG